MWDYKLPITVAELIDKLNKLPQDANIITTDWDSEYGGTYYRHVYDVGIRAPKNGGSKDLVAISDGLCKEDWYEEDTWDDEDDDEVDYDSEEESTPYMTEEEVEKHLAWIRENEGSL